MWSAAQVREAFSSYTFFLATLVAKTLYSYARVGTMEALIGVSIGIVIITRSYVLTRWPIVDSCALGVSMGIVVGLRVYFLTRWCPSTGLFRLMLRFTFRFRIIVAKQLSFPRGWRRLGIVSTVDNIPRVPKELALILLPDLVDLVRNQDR